MSEDLGRLKTRRTKTIEKVVSGNLEQKEKDYWTQLRPRTYQKDD